jgi:hypothetical protein
MVDLGGYVIVLVEQNGKIKLYGKCNLFKFKNKTKLQYINVWEFDRIAETTVFYMKPDIIEKIVLKEVTNKWCMLCLSL